MNSSKKFWYSFLFLLFFQLADTFLYMSSIEKGFREFSLDYAFLIFIVIACVLAYKLSLRRYFSFFASLFIFCSLITFFGSFSSMQWMPDALLNVVSLFNRYFTALALPLGWAVLFYSLRKDEAKKWSLVWVFLSGIVLGSLPYFSYYIYQVQGGSPALNFKSAFSVIALLFMIGAWLLMKKLTLKESMPKKKVSLLWSITLLAAFLMLALLELNCSITMKFLMKHASHSAEDYVSLAAIYSQSIGILTITFSILSLILSLIFIYKKGLTYTVLFLMLIVGLIPVGEYVFLYMDSGGKISHYFLFGATFPAIKYYLYVLLLIKSFAFPAGLRFQSMALLIFLPFLKNLLLPIGSVGILYAAMGDNTVSMKSLAVGQGGVFVILWAITLFFAYRLCKRLKETKLPTLK